jgi:hypothetical protein
MAAFVGFDVSQKFNRLKVPSAEMPEGAISLHCNAEHTRAGRRECASFPDLR